MQPTFYFLLLLLWMKYEIMQWKVLWTEAYPEEKTNNTEQLNRPRLPNHSGKSYLAALF